MVADDPEAPAWDLNAWLAEWAFNGDPIDTVAADLATATGAYLPKSPQDAEAAREIQRADDAHAEAIDDRIEALEAERTREWTAYGAALRTRIIELVEATPDLNVPVNVTIDITTYPRWRSEPRDAYAARLLDAAIEATPAADATDPQRRS